MWCVALCHDVAGGATARSALFEAHVAHNVANMGSFLFTGPLASADGVAGTEDDPRLLGSIYCLDAADLDAARGIMEADPYFRGAWRQIDYYRWDDPAGAWLDEAVRPKGLSAAYRCYVAAGRAPLSIDGALMNGAISCAGSTGTEAEPLSSLALLQARDIEEAKARAASAAWVAAAPVAIGRWVRISSAAELAEARSQNS